MSEITISRRADLRYAAQNYEIEVALPSERAGFDARLVRERFYERHRALYSYATDEPVECVALRVTALAPGAILRLPERRPTGPPLLATDQPCHLPGVGDVRVSVHSREGLGVGETIEGPALVEDEQSTTVVLPGQRARADAIGNLLLELT
jgi:N-methylhydantoinase A